MVILPSDILVIVAKFMCTECAKVMNQEVQDGKCVYCGGELTSRKLGYMKRKRDCTSFELANLVFEEGRNKTKEKTV